MTQAAERQRELDPSTLAFGANDLVPAIVQDEADGRVLMLAWMDAEALDATLRTGEVHFHSRSRGSLWRKGETSGNVLRLVSVAPDCDRDALLVTARPVGPTCHRGTRSCFDADGTAQPAATERKPGEPRPGNKQGFDWLETLWSTIAERAATSPEGSYTAELLACGVDAVARKVAEEAIEVVIAAKDDAAIDAGDPRRAAIRDAMTGEVADLLYHTLVLLAERDLSPESVLGVLRERHAT